MKPRKKKQKRQSLSYMGARLLLNCQECPLTELFCYSCLLGLRKKIKLASKLSFFCYLNAEIERKKEEKFDSLLWPLSTSSFTLTHSLQCRRILGGQNLVRVRNIVVATIFDFMTV